MSLTKRHADVTYSPADLARLTAVLSEAQALTKPLPSEETTHMKRLAKMGLKSESFAHEALDVARAFPALLPVGLDLERMAANLRNRDLLQAYLVVAEQIFARIRAALVLHGVDAYADGLTVYRSLQHNGDEEVRELVEKLGRIFKGKGKRKKKERDAEGIEGAAPRLQSLPASVKAEAPSEPARQPVPVGARVSGGPAAESCLPNNGPEPEESATGEAQHAGIKRSVGALPPRRHSGESTATFRDARRVYGSDWPLVFVAPSGAGPSRYGWIGAPALVSFATFDPGVAHLPR